jgi:phosphoglycerate dehydrogenase-like enzyme
LGPAGVDHLRAGREFEVAFGSPECEHGLGPEDDPAVVEARVTEALDAALAEIDALCAIVMFRQLAVTDAMLAAAPRLRVLFVPSSGTDAIDVAAATARGVVVVSAPGNNLTAVAESTVGMMLSLHRKIAVSDRFAHREGRLPHPTEIGGHPGSVRGRTIGIVGFGYIGREVGRICGQGLGMSVLAYDPFFDPIEARRQGAVLVDDLGELVREADVVSVHTPLSEATRNIIGAAELAAMKPTAFLINTSRGGTVDTDALVQALQDGAIAGAALDVTEPDPLPDGHPLHSLESVILTPHLAGTAPELLAGAVRTASDGALAALRGRRPRNLVNPAVWPAYLDRIVAA